MNEGYVQRIVCFQNDATPCECDFTAVIGIQNCGQWYAYEVQGVPQCDTRYCMTVGGDSDIVTAGNEEPLHHIPYRLIVHSNAAVDSERVVESKLAILLLTIILLILIALFIFISGIGLLLSAMSR